MPCLPFYPKSAIFSLGDTHQLDHSVNVLETLVLDHIRVQIIVQVSIVDGQPLHVEAKRGEPLGIGLSVDYQLATG